MKLSAELLTCIRGYIDSRDGAHVSPLSIQREFGISPDYVSRHLRELVKLGLIAEAGTTRLRTYANLEPVVAKLPVDLWAVYKAPALKVDKHRSELYTKLARARAAIPSIG